MKHEWIEVDGLKYIAVYEVERNTCDKCAFWQDYEHAVDVCRVVKCSDHIYVPLEVQHIPNLRKKGKKL